MTEWWVTLLITLAGAIISALASGFITACIEKRKQKHRDQEKRKEEMKKQYEVRPRLEIQEFKDLKHGRVESESDFACLLLNIKDKIQTDESFFFVYDEKALNKNNLCCVEYKFINTGKTEIDSICIISNQPKTTSIVELDDRDYLIKNGLLSYDAQSKKRFIKPGESISIKVCYLGNQIIGSPLSAVTAIYMEDINGNLWHQSLFCPTIETNNSTRVNKKDFYSFINTRAAIACFKDPRLW